MTSHAGLQHDLKPADPAAALQTPSHELIAAALRPRLLVVDDEPLNIDLLTDIFDSDYDVLSARDGVAALSIASSNKPDLVLLDVMMPGMSGHEVCKALKTHLSTRDIPVIFITGLGNSADETKGLVLGAVDYVTKPFNPAAVRARVDNHLRFKQEHEKVLFLAAKEHECQMNLQILHSAEINRLNREELAQKDDFLSAVSHELRSPLTSIYSFSSLIADGLAGATTSQQDQYLQVILQNSEHLRLMIRDLLLVNQSRSGKLLIDLTQVPVCEALTYAVQTLYGAAQAKSITLTSSCHQQVSCAHADPLRLQQVLIILLDNAIKFTPANGQVIASCSVWANDPAMLLFEVCDTGCGIDEAQRERIFDNFYQVSAASEAGRRGLGLGLHIAKDLVERQGGAIWVENGPAKGSRFFFSLPISTSATTTPA